MKKTFTVTLRSKDTEVGDSKLSSMVRDAVQKSVPEDVRVTVKRAKDLDPAK